MLANDENAIAYALGKIVLSPDEVDPTKEELVALMRGRNLSGGLEFTSLEGYYVTNPLSSGEVFALLILSVDNRIFWGPVDDFFAKN